MRRLFSVLLALALWASLPVSAPAQFTYFYSATAAAPFTPTSISGLTWWLKADAGVFSDLGTTPAVANDPVEQWNDQSGSGNNCTQATLANRPAFKTAIIGSMPVLRGDGTNGFMSCPSVYPTGTQPYTMFVVSVQRSVAQLNALVGDTGGTVDHALYYNNSGSVTYFQGGANQLVSTTATGTGVTSVQELGVVGRTNAGGGTTQAVNITTNGNYNTGIVDTSVNTTSAIHIFEHAGVDRMNGDIAEILLYTKTLTRTETNNVVNYLNGRWGTTITLWPATKQVIFDGDSITQGFKGQPPWAMLTQAHEAAFAVNLGSQGIKMSEMVTQGATVVDPLFDANVTKNIVVAFACTNDIALGGASGATCAASAHQYCLDRHAAGWKAVWVPMLPRGSAGNETDRSTLNTTEAADACWDAQVLTSCSAAMWGAGNNTNLTNYDADQVHPNTTGHALVATCIEAAIDTL